MRTRQQLEQIESLSLAPYGARSAESRGREFPEAEPPYRTAFQRDRERVLHTTAFRRLQGKTQVFVVTEGDYYRTRITHTMEVAQIGRTIARALGASEDLVEGVCLAHDLGHPPFGHSGETILAELMRDHGGFDHNRHSYRLITELERRYPDFPGLNLTYEFREGIVKHETEYDVAARSGQDYELGLRGSLEAQIASYADELAYNAHDLDDGLRAGLLDIGDVQQLAWWQRAREAAGVPAGEPFTDLVRHRTIRRLIGEMVTGLDHAYVGAPGAGRRRQRRRRPPPAGRSGRVPRSDAGAEPRAEVVPVPPPVRASARPAHARQVPARGRRAVPGLQRRAAHASGGDARTAQDRLARARGVRLHRRNDRSLRLRRIRAPVRSARARMSPCNPRVVISPGCVGEGRSLRARGAPVPAQNKPTHNGEATWLLNASAQ